MCDRNLEPDENYDFNIQTIMKKFHLKQIRIALKFAKPNFNFIQITIKIINLR